MRSELKEATTLLVALAVPVLAGLVTAVLVGDGDPTSAVVQSGLTLAVVGGPVLVLLAYFLERSVAPRGIDVPPPHLVAAIGIAAAAWVVALLCARQGGALTIPIGMLAGAGVVGTMKVRLARAQRRRGGTPPREVPPLPDETEANVGLGALQASEHP